MLSTLRRRKMRVSAVAEDLRLPVKTVSRNLRLLERAGVLLSDPRRGYVFYRINPDVRSWCGMVLDAAGAAKDTRRWTAQHSLWKY